MNQRNVEALAVLVQEADIKYEDAFQAGMSNQLQSESMWKAQWLASRGVLVPSVITDSEWYNVVKGDEGNSEECIAALERIAKWA